MNFGFMCKPKFGVYVSEKAFFKLLPMEKVYRPWSNETFSAFNAFNLDIELKESSSLPVQHIIKKKTLYTVNDGGGSIMLWNYFSSEMRFLSGFLLALADLLN